MTQDASNIENSGVTRRLRRKAVIEELEAKRNSKLLVYFCGDRPNFVANIAPDSVRWIYDHMLSMNNGKNVDQIDLYLYSIGGSIRSSLANYIYNQTIL